ncbi:hypothetical protein LRS10_18600 [Phenylobacterium sp. J426]|uniref:hypothetical protein n=1 Tax=Phenylobacterium sp. J426 TaxID=2898439 RepID=UPI0021514C32|nr:hypothetical protein [Phenylobacterium sp. J426]MCR5875980.1 hypothetical protein [Phenylobacterium sp. J426]
MTLVQRLCVGVAALVMSAAAGQAAAATPSALSERDVRAYRAAFAAADQGDFVGAQLELAEVQDTSLQGYLSFRQLMHPTAHKATFEELAGWLGHFRDLPLADRVFNLAKQRKPADAPPPPVPAVAGVDSKRSEATFAARDAFYSGDARRAYMLAVESADRWIAGLAAFRLRDYATAQDYFVQVAGDDDEDVWQRSAAAYWAYRAATAVGDPVAGQAFLRRAALNPQTFYGMIAARQVQLTTAAAAATGQFVLASYNAPPPPAARPRPQGPAQPRTSALHAGAAARAPRRRPRPDRPHGGRPAGAARRPGAGQDRRRARQLEGADGRDHAGFGRKRRPGVPDAGRLSAAVAGA